ncbi:MAG: hydroxymethylglutaryl-CoA synthase, partial [Haloferacaceae archaeon]|nr:hydroxymethylglutaryl-CoA synthase [Haloferacaceae archaeon]
VDGKRSVQVYLARMREALEDYESVAGATHPDAFRFVPFHTPYPGMVRKAALLGYRHMIRDTPVETALADELGMQPQAADFDDAAAYEAAIRAYMDGLKQTDRYQAWFAERIAPTVQLSAAVGNWYTGSVHLARFSTLQAAHAAGEDLAGEDLLVGSYGSGSQAEIHRETVVAGWESALEGLDLQDRLDARYDLSVEEYERIHDVHNHDKEVEIDPLTEPAEEFVFAGWGRMGERRYEYAA